LWVTDGTFSGTHLVKDINPGNLTSAPEGLTAFGDKLAFFARDVWPGTRDLWITDGTEAGTQKAAEVEVDGTFAIGTAVAGGKLFFPVADPTELLGHILAVYDGVSVDTPAPGVGVSSVVPMAACGSRLYFGGTDALLGNELFVTDGTAAGTQLVVDLVPGMESSTPGAMALVGGELLFAATGPDGDRELYRYSLPGAHVVDLGFGGNGAGLAATSPLVGGSMVATVTDAPAGSIGLLLMSARASANATLVLPGNASWIDATSFLILGVSSLPTWAVASTIPLDPSLTGLEANLQAWFLPPEILPALTSNGLRLVFGD
jgi:ELWxxDGT repeat protein